MFSHLYNWWPVVSRSYIKCDKTFGKSRSGKAYFFILHVHFFRIQCVLKHVCPKNCADVCGPCMRKVLKKLPCGHEMQVNCYLEPEDPTIRCLTMVETTLPDCKHKVITPTELLTGLLVQFCQHKQCLPKLLPSLTVIDTIFIQ